MLDRIIESSLLFDFYGELLSQRQREVMSLYHEENLSLAEIANEYDISRAAVYDSLKKAEKALTQYEEKLGLVKRFILTSEAIEKIDTIIDEVNKEHGDDKALSSKLEKVKTIIDDLEEL